LQRKAFRETKVPENAQVHDVGGKKGGGGGFLSKSLYNHKKTKRRRGKKKKTETKQIGGGTNESVLQMRPTQQIPLGLKSTRKSKKSPCVEK